MKKKIKQTEIGLISKNWDIKELDLITNKVCVGYVGKCIYAFCNKEEGVPLIRTTNLKENKLDFSDLKYVTDEFHARNKKSQLRKGDLLVARHGSNGLTCVFNEKFEANCLNIVIIKVNENKASSKFLLYAFKSSLVKNQINSNVGGSVQGVVNTKIISKLKIPYPNEVEREQIASILSSFDDKIELLEKQNETLEKIGEVLFKYWFVDFEFPNENGEPYKSSGGKMIWSEELQKEIPEGWMVSKIGSELNTVLGGTPSREIGEYWSGKIPWINSGKVNEFRVIFPSETISEIALKKSATELMPKGTTLIAITGATLGQVSLLEIDSCANQSVVGIKESTKLKKSFVYYFIKHNILNIIGYSTGGAQQHINKENINQTKILIPQDEILEKYYNQVELILEKISLNCFQIEDLKQTRDLLLPKLMSGKIRVEF